MKNSAFFIFIFIVFSCSQSKLKVQTVPSNVEVKYEENNGRLRSLGMTPLEIDLGAQHFNSGAAKLLFNKEGYKDEVVFLGKPAIQSKVEVSIRMKEVTDVKQILSNEKLEKLSSKIAKAQKFTHVKNYFKAESILLNIIEEFPTVSVPYDLLANIYFLSNENDKALRYYKKAKAISPDNIKRDLLINKLSSGLNKFQGGDI